MLERRCFVLFLVFCVVMESGIVQGQSSGTLYALSSVWFSPGSSTPATLLSIDVTTNTTTEVMNWSFSKLVSSWECYWIFF